jgi:hypothetical protein
MAPISFVKRQGKSYLKARIWLININNGDTIITIPLKNALEKLHSQDKVKWWTMGYDEETTRIRILMKWNNPTPNGDVIEEFYFLRFLRNDDDGTYYNFHLNPLGRVHKPQDYIYKYITPYFYAQSIPESFDFVDKQVTINDAIDNIIVGEKRELKDVEHL